MPLSPKRLRFVDEYVLDMNGAQAAVRAGYSSRSAKVTASRLLTDANVQQAVAERTLALAEKVDVTAEWVLTRLQGIAENAAKDSDRNRALELIGKHLGMFIERSLSVSAFVRPELRGRSIQELEAIEAALFPESMPAIGGEVRMLDEGAG